MNNEYNDYQILSPEKMEELAKKYQEELRNNSSPKPSSQTQLPESFYECFFQLKHTLATIKNYLTKRRKKDNRVFVIDKMLSSLSEIKSKQNFSKQLKYAKSYYDAVKICFVCISQMIDNLLSTNSKSDNIFTFLTILKDLTALL